MDGSARNPSLDDLLGQERWLQALARRLVRDAATADDLVQETWFRALRSRRAGAAEARDARSWLGTALRNVWRERGRSERERARRERVVARDEALPSAREAFERIELQQRLAAHLLALPEPYRSTLALRYHEGRSAAEIAAQSGEPADRVRWRLMRARELLRERLDRDAHDWTVRFSLFLPLARRVPRPTLAASAGAATVLSMSAKTILAACAGLLLIGSLALLRDDAREREPGTTSSASGAPLVAADPVREAPQLERERAALPAPPASAPGVVAARSTGVRLDGTVRAAEDGHALADVAVVLFAPGGRTRAAETATGAEGTFALDALEAGTYDLVLHAATRPPRRLAEVAVAGDTTLDLELEPGFALDVEVVERASGAPIAGAEVRLVPGDLDRLIWFSEDELDAQDRVARTGLDGRVRIEGLGRGVHQTHVAAEGHATALGQALVEPDSPSLRIALERGGVVTGLVGAADGTPVSDARVFLNPLVYRKSLDTPILGNGALTDALGRYRIEGVPPDAYHAVVLRADGSGTFHLDPEDPGELAPVLVEDGSEVTLDFRIPRPGAVHGRVVDERGEPVENARVSVSWGDFKPGRAGFFPIANVPGVKDSIHHETVTDADGRFAIDTLRTSHRPFTFRLQAEGCVKDELQLDVPAGALLEPLVTLQRLGATIRGRLTDPDGEAVTDHSVGAFELEDGHLGAFFQARSDADGAYELLVPAGGTVYRVFPIVRQSSAVTSEPERREGVRAGAEGVDFVLVARRRLLGRVVDESDRPVRDFVVHALVARAGEEPRWDEWRDANRGDGRLDVFLTDDLTELRVSAPGLDPASIVDLAAPGERRIVLAHAGDVAGVVVDAQGHPVAGAVVALATLDAAIYAPGTPFAPRDVTDAQGRFRLRGVPDPAAVPGPGDTRRGHLLVCPGRDDAPVLVRAPIPADRSDLVRIELPSALPVTLVFESASGQPAEGLALVLDAEGWPLEPAAETHLADQTDETRGVLQDGRVRLVLAPGTYRVVLIEGVTVRGTFPLEVTDGEGAAGPRDEHVFRVP